MSATAGNEAYMMTSADPARQAELGIAIKAARKAVLLSQQDLAAAIGVRQSSVSQWERGATAPSTGHLLQLLRILGAPLVRLLIGDDMTVGMAESAKASLSGQGGVPVEPQPSCGFQRGGASGVWTDRR